MLQIRTKHGRVSTFQDWVTFLLGDAFFDSSHDLGNKHVESINLIYRLLQERLTHIMQTRDFLFINYGATITVVLCILYDSFQLQKDEMFSCLQPLPVQNKSATWKTILTAACL